MSSDSPFLPPELYRTIIERYWEIVKPNAINNFPHHPFPLNLQQERERHKMLCPLLFVSKVFYREATRLIYHSAFVSLEDEEGRGFQLLRMMAKSPHITKHIVSFVASVSTTPGILEREQVGDAEVTDLLLVCLQHMPALTSWSFNHAAGCLPLILERLAHSDCPFYLTNIHFFCHQAVDPFLWPFIQTQRSITSFTYTSNCWDVQPIPPIHIPLLPRVQSLSTTGQIAAGILKTGPRPSLKHLRINVRHTLPVARWTNTDSVLSLSVNSLGRPPSEAFSVLTSFHNLVNVFILSKYSNEWETHQNIDLQPLCSLPRLRILFLGLLCHADFIHVFVLRIMLTVEWLEACYFSTRHMEPGRYVRIDSVPHFEKAVEPIGVIWERYCAELSQSPYEI